MTTKIEKALSLGKVNGAKALLAEYYLAQDKSEFYAGLQAEYDAMYPTYRDMTEEEQLAYDEENFTEEEPKPEEFIYPQVEIGYITYEEVTETVTPEEGEPYEVTNTVEVRTPAEYVTYNEYINETVVVQEAVEATYDEEGMELTPAVPEVIEMVRPFVAQDTTDRVNTYIGSQYAKLRQYPSIEEQMDMLYWDKINGTNTWQDAITAEKERVPKAV